MKETRKGMLLVISGPSGTGKGTLARQAAAGRSQLYLFRIGYHAAKRSNEIG